jgi:hypothetical protein
MCLYIKELDISESNSKIVAPLIDFVYTYYVLKKSENAIAYPLIKFLNLSKIDFHEIEFTQILSKWLSILRELEVLYL